MTVDFDNLICPFGCPTGTPIKSLGTEQTLLGWGGKPDQDPNHFTQRCFCEGCKASFCKEWVPAGKKVWYSTFQDGKRFVLLGEAGCCQESYFVGCKCGGWSRHSTRAKGAGYIIEDGKSRPLQPMYWKCERCGELGPDRRYGLKYIEGA